MAFIEWSEQYSVSIPKIDEQHKKLLDLVNKLHGAMASGQGKDALGTILEELIQYTDYHFKTEEAAFSRYGYSEAEVHKEQHQNLLNTANDLQKKYQKGTMLISVETLNFLVEWVTNHILVQDKQYVSLLKGKDI